MSYLRLGTPPGRGIGASTYIRLGSSEPTNSSRGKPRQGGGKYSQLGSSDPKKDGKSKQASPECNIQECYCGAHIHMVSLEGLSYCTVKQVLLLCFEIRLID